MHQPKQLPLKLLRLVPSGLNYLSSDSLEWDKNPYTVILSQLHHWRANRTSTEQRLKQGCDCTAAQIQLV